MEWWSALWGPVRGPGRCAGRGLQVGGARLDADGRHLLEDLIGLQALVLSPKGLDQDSKCSELGHETSRDRPLE